MWLAVIQKVGFCFNTSIVQDQEAQYKLLLSLQSELLSFMKDGVSARDAYQYAISYVKSNMPDLEKNFVKSIGFGVISFQTLLLLVLRHFSKMGIEFRDAGYILSAKNTRLLRQNMIFNLSLGFTSLSDAGGQKFGGSIYQLRLLIIIIIFIFTDMLWILLTP